MIQDRPQKLVVFSLDMSRYALPLADVKRVVPLAEITLLPRAPEIVLGIINVGGRVIPAVNTRRRFGMPDRELSLADQFIVAQTARRTVALLVDRVNSVIEKTSSDITLAGRILPGLEYVRGVAKLPDGLVLIHDLGTFLSLEEERNLDEALARAARE